MGQCWFLSHNSAPHNERCISDKFKFCNCCKNRHMIVKYWKLVICVFRLGILLSMHLANERWRYSLNVGHTGRREVENTGDIFCHLQLHHQVEGMKLIMFLFPFQSVDECSSNPCTNGGACSEGVGFFSCSCRAGFTGTTCETNIDDCLAAVDPCPAANTRCVDGIDGYVCECTLEGFEGEKDMPHSGLNNMAAV